MSGRDLSNLESSLLDTVLHPMVPVELCRIQKASGLSIFSQKQPELKMVGRM
jgi:hypothetical protein